MSEKKINNADSASENTNEDPIIKVIMRFSRNSWTMSHGQSSYGQLVHESIICENEKSV